MTLLHRPPRGPGPLRLPALPAPVMLLSFARSQLKRGTWRERAGHTSSVREGPDMRFACVTSMHTPRGSSESHGTPRLQGTLGNVVSGWTGISPAKTRGFYYSKGEETDGVGAFLCRVGNDHNKYVLLYCK